MITMDKLSKLNLKIKKASSLGDLMARLWKHLKRLSKLK